MNPSDGRTVVEQVKSGLRLTGLILLALTFFVLMGGSANLLLAAGVDTHLRPRLLGLLGLVGTSAVLFFTVRRWAKWLVGALLYVAAKAAISLLLGFTPSAPAIAGPRLLFMEMLVLALVGVALCKPYLNHFPSRIEVRRWFFWLTRLSSRSSVTQPCPPSQASRRLG